MKPKLQRNPYEYRRNLPHLTKADRAHFVTFNSHLRKTLPPAARDEVLRAFKHHDGEKYLLVAVLVLPEHVHAILVPDRDDSGDPLPVSTALHSIKSFTANRIRKLELLDGKVWQDESMDHIIRHEDSLEQKIDYVRMNPVRRGLVKKPEDYPWLWIKQFEE